MMTEDIIILAGGLTFGVLGAVWARWSRWRLERANDRPAGDMLANKRPSVPREGATPVQLSAAFERRLLGRIALVAAGTQIGVTLVLWTVLQLV